MKKAHEGKWPNVRLRSRNPITEQDKMTDVQQQLDTAKNLSPVGRIFTCLIKPKRKTRADAAREQGLQPHRHPCCRAAGAGKTMAFINDKVLTAEDALLGSAQDIIARNGQ